ncbi:hypothetical protein NL676_004129 [Syzygium grande]|nr:hypothetical protein NL676_004129 [Syzygium grande]
MKLIITSLVIIIPRVTCCGHLDKGRRTPSNVRHHPFWFLCFQSSWLPLLWAIGNQHWASSKPAQAIKWPRSNRASLGGPSQSPLDFEPGRLFGSRENPGARSNIIGSGHTDPIRLQPEAAARPNPTSSSGLRVKPKTLIPLLRSPASAISLAAGEERNRAKDRSEISRRACSISNLCAPLAATAPPCCWR